MKGFLAVFERELAERRLLAAAALGFGLLAALLPLVPGFQKGGLTDAELRGGVALGLALILSSLTAVFLGGSVLASDLLQRRLGFYFSRPLSAWALWAGKVAAALVLTFGSALLVLLPAALLGGSLNPGGVWGTSGPMSASDAFALWAAGLLLLFFGANALVVMVRSRSLWVALDIAALILVAAAVWDARTRLILAGVGAAPSPHWWVDPLSVFTWMGNTLVLGSLAGLAAAGALQVVRGRTDVRRAHRSLSVTLWTLLAVLGLTFEILTLWWVRVSPSDLLGVTQVVAAPSSSSSWIAFEGPAAHRPGYNPVFLYDVESGRTFRTQMGTLSAWWSLPLRISKDGSRAVWLEFQGLPFRSPLTLYKLDLRRPGARPEPTRITLLGSPDGLALSPDGRRVALASRNRLTVEDLDTGRLLASVGYGGELWFSRLSFAGPDRVWLYQAPGQIEAGFAPYDIYELDVATGKVSKTGRLTDVRGYSGWLVSPDGERALLRTRTQLQLRDARTGELLADFGALGRFASFLDDGRVTLVSPEKDLILLDRDGARELRRFHLEGAKAVIPVDQPAPGSLRVVTSRTGDPGSHWTLHLLDLQTGAVRFLGERRLALLGTPKPTGLKLSLEGAQGVVWKDSYSLRERVILKD